MKSITLIFSLILISSLAIVAAKLKPAAILGAPTCANPEYNFSDIKLQSSNQITMDHEFVIENATDNPCYPLKYSASCSCTKVHIPDSIPAHSFGVIKTCTTYYDGNYAGKKSLIKISFKGTNEVLNLSLNGRISLTDLTQTKSLDWPDLAVRKSPSRAVVFSYIDNNANDGAFSIGEHSSQLQVELIANATTKVDSNRFLHEATVVLHVELNDDSLNSENNAESLMFSYCGKSTCIDISWNKKVNHPFDFKSYVVTDTSRLHSFYINYYEISCGLMDKCELLGDGFMIQTIHQLNGVCIIELKTLFTNKHGRATLRVKTKNKKIFDIEVST